MKAASPEAALAPFRDYMDFSNVPASHPLHSNERLHQLGFLKDETALKSRIVGAVCLKAKCYSLLFESREKEAEQSHQNKCKGVKQSVAKRLRFEDYKRVLLDVSGELRGSQQSIRSYAHRIYRITQKKRVFNSFEDKTQTLVCQIHSRSLGHYRTEQIGFFVKNAENKNKEQTRYM